MKPPAKKSLAAPCPCGRPLTYAACCGRYHAGAAAPDAETLMRSRYSAYVHTLEAYLLATWHASTRPTALHLGTPPQPKWLGLEVKAAHVARDAARDAASDTANDTEDDTATVEFVARCRIGGRAQRMHEISRFVREDGRWYYVDGDIDEAVTPTP